MAHHALHAPEDGNHIAALDLQVDGSYRYFADVREGQHRTAEIGLFGKSATIRFFSLLKTS